MKFRAKITSLLLVKQFAQLLQNLSRCSSKAVLRLSHDKVYFILKDAEAKNKGGAVWCEGPIDAFFGEYAMEGFSKPSDEIYLDVNLEMLAARIGALKSAHSVSSVKVKLTNKVMPCLTFEIESDTFRSKTLCVHDIPVSVIPKSMWKEYEEPEVPEFDINISVPEIRLVRSALERIKGSGSRATVTGCSDGWLEIAMNKFTVKSAVKFKDLTVLKYQDEDDQDGNPRNSKKSLPTVREPNSDSNEESSSFSVEVDTRSLWQLIHTEDQRPDNCLCSIHEGRLLHIFYVYGDVMIKYLLPGLAS